MRLGLGVLAVTDDSGWICSPSPAAGNFPEQLGDVGFGLASRALAELNSGTNENARTDQRAAYRADGGVRSSFCHATVGIASFLVFDSAYLWEAGTIPSTSSGSAFGLGCLPLAVLGRVGGHYRAVYLSHGGSIVPKFRRVDR